MMGKVVRVVLVDGRMYVGRLECIDRDCNLFMSICSEIIDNEKPYAFHYEVFTPTDKKTRFEYRLAGHLIIPKAQIVQVLLDKKLSEKYPEDETVVKRETILEIH